MWSAAAARPRAPGLAQWPRSVCILPSLSCPGDLSGHLLAYLSLSPIFVIVGFVTLIIFKRELHTVSEPPTPAPPALPPQGGAASPVLPRR